MFAASISGDRPRERTVSAALELFRNGDVSVTTNGVAYPPSEASAEGGSMRGAYLPRELPFPHAGFGQDDEWVTGDWLWRGKSA